MFEKKNPTHTHSFRFREITTRLYNELLPNRLSSSVQRANAIGMNTFCLKKYIYLYSHQVDMNNNNHHTIV